MSGTSMTFVVPRSGIEGVAKVVFAHYGTMPGTAAEDVEGIAAFLSSRVGESIQVEFEDEFEQGNPVTEMAEALDTVPTSYFGYWPSHEERSRGDRFDGGYVYRISPDSAPCRKRLPWSAGEPTPLDEDMRAASIPDDDIRDIVSIFFPSTAQPAPAA